MVYDVSNEESFNHISDWFIEVNRYAAEGTSKLIVGNKCDKTDKIVPTEKALAFANKMGIPFIETSALNSTNVELAFVTLTRELLKSRYGTLTNILTHTCLYVVGTHTQTHTKTHIFVC
jgi:Ras-related protein Rab-1A